MEDFGTEPVLPDWSACLPTIWEALQMGASQTHEASGQRQPSAP